MSTCLIFSTRVHPLALVLTMINSLATKTISDYLKAIATEIPLLGKPDTLITLLSSQ